MDRRFNYLGHSNARKVWYLNGMKFESDKNTNNGKQKAVAYARANMLDEKAILTFDSEMEFKRFLFLKQKELKGEITELKDHFNFQLLPPFENLNGMEHEELLYEADFFYYDNVNLKYVVEDVKGNIEDTFRVKWKLFDRIYMKRGLALTCIRLKSGRNVDYLKSENWDTIEENQKPQKRNLKMREELKALKQEKAQREKAEALEARERSRLAILEGKEKLTTTEKKRLEYLREKYAK